MVDHFRLKKRDQIKVWIMKTKLLSTFFKKTVTSKQKLTVKLEPDTLPTYSES